MENTKNWINTLILKSVHFVGLLYINVSQRTLQITLPRGFNQYVYLKVTFYISIYKGADKSLARPGRKQATATEDFDLHVSYL